ncbi:hypothetical protein EJ03DRAFT_153719 [Teratosphaeria nubilosa]|uniref:Uncharacterized protein n=1 Tax=Teratosphaeria nubilosa TaxID=161662 RepID=A0A6G1LJF6_9PEZI|nr:hypothetical protein EJ03DRAFT_153719 [Teratosphaeria nubilosa]
MPAAAAVLRTVTRLIHQGAALVLIMFPCSFGISIAAASALTANADKRCFRLEPDQARGSVADYKLSARQTTGAKIYGTWPTALRSLHMVAVLARPSSHNTTAFRAAHRVMPGPMRVARLQLAQAHSARSALTALTCQNWTSGSGNTGTADSYSSTTMFCYSDSPICQMVTTMHNSFIDHGHVQQSDYI